MNVAVDSILPQVEGRALLTRMQLDTLALVTSGLTPDEAAKRLYVTKRTVDFHLLCAYRRLGVDNLLAAYHACIRLGLLPCPCGHVQAARKEAAA